jgi:YNFM family putative membrane transporter
MAAIYLVTILTISALYAPQPLLPVIVSVFGVTPTEAAALTTVSFLPLALAPLFYGPLLERVEPLKMLRWGVALLAISQWLFYLSESFTLLLTLRLFQGLLIPALLTAAMTYLSLKSTHKNVSRAMAYHITATIVGGLLGRVCSGMFATLWGWRSSFLILGISLVVGLLLLTPLLPVDRTPDKRPGSWKRLPEVLSNPLFRRVYLMVFCFFLVFAAIMNFIPFRLHEVSGAANEFRIGLMYSGYLMGIATALNAVRIRDRLGSEQSVIRVGLSLYLVALLVMLTPSIPVLFVSMFLFCGTMFLVHATSTGWLNYLSSQHQGTVNGLYVASYYGGGMVGSFVPGLVYQAFGWGPFIAVLAAVLSIALFLAFRLGES